MQDRASTLARHSYHRTSLPCRGLRQRLFAFLAVTTFHLAWPGDSGGECALPSVTESLESSCCEGCTRTFWKRRVTGELHSPHPPTPHPCHPARYTHARAHVYIFNTAPLSPCELHSPGHLPGRYHRYPTAHGAAPSWLGALCHPAVSSAPRCN
jgi:hypothetical protein